MRVGWWYLRRFGLAGALERFPQAIRPFATQAGAPDKYHQTTTVSWLLLIEERLDGHAEASAHNPKVGGDQPPVLPQSLTARRAAYGLECNTKQLVSQSDIQHGTALRADAAASHTEWRGIAMQENNDVADRKAFYDKVAALVSTEPAKDQVMSNSVSNTHWQYGFSAYPESAAVNIQTKSQSVSKPWKIGWQEATLEFGPDSAYLIVGWQVIANWEDGVDGQWRKEVDQILLTSHGAVHVKSEYDRGFNWTVNYFVVDASEYQFNS